MATNGNVPSSDLTLVGGKLVHKSIAPQLIALRAAYFQRFGVPLFITSAYRDYATQVYLRSLYLSGRGAYAVPPGTSNHGWGMAVDFGGNVRYIGTVEHTWMVANAPRYGFVWLRRAGNGSIEPWHFDASVVPASNYQDTPGATIEIPGGSAPEALTPQRKGRDMAYIIQGADGPAQYGFNGVERWHIPDLYTKSQVEEMYEDKGAVRKIGQYALDRIPLVTNVGVADPAKIAAAVVALLPKDTNNDVDPDEIADAVIAALGLKLTTS